MGRHCKDIATTSGLAVHDIVSRLAKPRLVNYDELFRSLSKQLLRCPFRNAILRKGISFVTYLLGKLIEGECVLFLEGCVEGLDSERIIPQDDLLRIEFPFPTINESNSLFHFLYVWNGASVVVVDGMCSSMLKKLKSRV